MLTKLTPERRLAHAIEARAVEAELIRKLVDLGDSLLGEADGTDPARWGRQREDIHAVLHGARAMMSDLVEDLGRLEERALALQDGRAEVQAAVYPSPPEGAS